MATHGTLHEPRRTVEIGVAWFAALVVGALYASWSLDHQFSDGLLCVSRVSHGPHPYYNVAYVPVGWAFHRSVAAIVGWDVERALEVLSALALAVAGALTYLWMRRAAVRAPMAAWWAVAFVIAPGVALHATVVEVHALQAFAAMVAILLADRAATAPPQRAWAALAGASAIAVLAHLTHVLLVPGLVVLALPRQEGRGLRMSQALARRVALVGAFVAGIVVLLQVPAVQRALPLPAWEWASMLVFFGKSLVGAWLEYGLRTPGEVAGFLRAELVGPAGALVSTPLLALVAWPRAEPATRSRLARALCLPLLAVLLFPQGGIWERGGYFLTYLPVFAFVGALSCESLFRAGRAWAPVAATALVLAVQAFRVDSERAALLAEGPDARAWAARVQEVLVAGDRVMVASLAKSLALKDLRADLTTPDLARYIDMVPRRHALATANVRLGATLTSGDGRGSVYLDEALWRGRSSNAMEQLAAHPRLRLTPVEGLPDGYRLLRVDVVPPGG
jgi:hypothetical protein